MDLRLVLALLAVTLNPGRRPLRSTAVRASELNVAPPDSNQELSGPIALPRFVLLRLLSSPRTLPWAFLCSTLGLMNHA